ncbi:C39 family peptidase [Aporhodopirellula aestuarii]|uniref:C39 family peptidase n=1 Tax=Aporhodopirellula aestuarii TaxID=2950107 RepID=A0ABT0UCY9_9BACT|nr:C39 family peptidase [Aporhodopirellula aestuarii]MCM2374630.1 C39 family peptidase [Aporhodopirellula aestuarii]
MEGIVGGDSKETPHWCGAVALSLEVCSVRILTHELTLEIQSQPNDTSCGPTCLAAVYDYWNRPVDLKELLGKIGELDGGGTLAVDLACDALERGYSASIVTYNLQLFDPTWFNEDGEIESATVLADRLERQLHSKKNHSNIDIDRLRASTQSYLTYLALGGQVRMQPLDEILLVSMLARETPILCGLSATYLYRESRETKWGKPDDIGGSPTGHFVVMHGFSPKNRTVLIADPLHPNPMAPTNKYVAPLARVTSAILLGIVTFDANLLTIFPDEKS